MDFIPYNSRLTYHKSPFGAVREGERVTMRIVLPRSLGCTGASLIIDSDGGSSRVYPMTWERMERTDEEWWRVTFTAEREGLYWYRFAVARRDGGKLITCFENSTGRISPDGTSFQLTVYSADMTTPDWIKGSVIYQIFPDRFNFSGKEKKNIPADRVIRFDWGGRPLWEPDSEGRIDRYDFFKGDLKGIEQKLDYLESLGIGCIYLNPIFEAQSNHRYDTADYERIDPLLGTEADFRSLCRNAEKRGIRIVLDGVFSHTGADSVYFNKNGRYKSPGAYNSEASPYYEWYKFKHYPDDYACWWGVDILPEVDEENESYLRFIAGEGGVLRKWLRAGASGWRLDVADELPDKFLDRLRLAVKAEKPDAYILGEVWEDGTTKIAYSQRRKYLLGRETNGLMNYPFRTALMAYLLGGGAEYFRDSMEQLRENYPAPAFYGAMNFLSTHDTPRAINAILDPRDGDRTDLAQRHFTQEQLREGRQRLKLAAFLQFMLPGMPCIYYGDEAGMTGYRDPFNRKFYPWGREDGNLVSFYQSLARVKKSTPALRRGTVLVLEAGGGRLMLLRQYEGKNVAVCCNRSENPWTLPHSGTILLGGGIAEYTGETLTLGQNGFCAMERK